MSQAAAGGFETIGLMEQFTLGPSRYFVPICIRHPHGFYGGPAGYQEIRDKAEAEARAPIVLEAETPLHFPHYGTNHPSIPPPDASHANR